ncbi:MAG: pyruvate carboxylase [Campylobacterota bacterium]|nr:pyruvate carboxylase [Campylobacterota bacterium]
MSKEIKKLLIANRGEIAIRVARAGNELGIRTIGIYSNEDKYSLHRFKMDETYLIGKDKDPVEAYLSMDEIIELALRKDIDAIHPGYGFLAENAEFAEKCRENNIIFIGPEPETLRLFEDKLKSKEIAERCNVPMIPGSRKALKDVNEAVTFAESFGYPIMLKASKGGGGRGLRIVKSEKDLLDNFESAKREAGKAFGSSDMFIEKRIEKPRHIEVQILADKYGDVVHLYERDCSIQRRHQKMIEITPARNIPEDVLQNLYKNAIKIAKTSNYVNAGTFEFLMDENFNYYFLETNPRIQVEHTVTERLTGIDIVHCQLHIAEGERLNGEKINLKQEDIKKRGCALQCRITTEDPGNNFMPDTGVIEAYRSPAGFGVRLDAGSAYGGARITPYYDSLLVKITSWGLTFEQAVKKMIRSLNEFRIRGVKTNIPFLLNVLRSKIFLEEYFCTEFIERHPELLKLKIGRDRATRLLSFLGNNIVNKQEGIKINENIVFPEIKEINITDTTIPKGSRDILEEKGVKGVMEWTRNTNEILFTDTTFRDAHQSLLATRIRTHDMLNVGKATSRWMSQLFSIEMWGGATFDVAYRFLKEDPWKRVEELKEKIPNILFQMLLRGSNAVGYSNYPDNVIRAFVKEASSCGIDVFRIFDCFNWLPQMKISIEEVKKQGKICEAAICYTGDILDKNREKYNLKYYVDLAKELEKLDVDIIAIKDMAGLCKPYAAKKLIKTLKQEVGKPIHFHTHDTSGNGEASMLMAIEAGADIVDAAISSMSGLTSQPNMNSIIRAVAHTKRKSSMDKEKLDEISNYWERVRTYYYPFESDLKASTAEVYTHEIPGGQYSNLKPQVTALGLIDRWEEVKKMYTEVNWALGDVIKVTPSSKVVGDLALFLVRNNLDIEDFRERADELSLPQSVMDFYKGLLGQPYGGFFPKGIRERVLKGETSTDERPGKFLPPFDFEGANKELKNKYKRDFKFRELISCALYPSVFEDYMNFNDEYGDVTKLSTKDFFYPLKHNEETSVIIEPGKKLFIRFISVGPCDEKGERPVYFELNGPQRIIKVKDEKTEVLIKQNIKGDLENIKHICATMPGKIISINVIEGQHVEKGDILATTEAMKMETKIVTACKGTIKKIYLKEKETIEARDLIIELE